jgi:hypothetical protein
MVSDLSEIQPVGGHLKAASLRRRLWPQLGAIAVDGAAAS